MLRDWRQQAQSGFGGINVSVGQRESLPFDCLASVENGLFRNLG
jgi:hypothetical protein